MTFLHKNKFFHKNMARNPTSRTSKSISHRENSQEMVSTVVINASILFSKHMWKFLIRQQYENISRKGAIDSDTGTFIDISPFSDLGGNF
mmetsp:Transcript_7748/g.16590  ORF Transcript_7748/g.16590 Transcript_7748/m.16590 type:complete len:90 (+) Transcript_7748:459-728(+)